MDKYYIKQLSDGNTYLIGKIEFNQIYDNPKISINELKFKKQLTHTGNIDKLIKEIEEYLLNSYNILAKESISLEIKDIKDGQLQGIIYIK
ncbi:hypothetical protein [Oceanobacillus kimchii]|uniref:Uncharacterized protein n=1 Tax=Oceanobacillus kimchii TaxID=746691 RepID=A0ABQ5TNM9_9BACI|nr:hypothetical protein [Oceanobacillus kimchii]GLO66162.1 hypothetical protein MACH08_19460 [Oceanobacillus kimchii]